MTSARLPAIEIRSSPLMQAAFADSRFDVTDFMGDGPYPGSEDEKAEAEAYVATTQTVLDGPEGDRLRQSLENYLRHLFPIDDIGAAGQGGQLPRLYGFSALQMAVDDAVCATEDESMEQPLAEDFVFDARPELFGGSGGDRR